MDLRVLVKRRTTSLISPTLQDRRYSGGMIWMLISVIFGCTNITFDECLNRKLFGLPRSHFSYVKMVKPGMPIFTYCSKKLFGVFEAVSYGEQCMDPYAWTDPSPYSQVKTRYPVQARVKLKEDFEKVISLDEEEFQTLIKENYYMARRFYFDLNCSQTYHLVKKFEMTRDCLRLISDALAASCSSSGARGWKATSTHQGAPECMNSGRRRKEVFSMNVGGEQERPLSHGTCHQRRYSHNSFPNFPVSYSSHVSANLSTAGPALASMQDVDDVTYNLNSDHTVELEKSDPAEAAERWINEPTSQSAASIDRTRRAELEVTFPTGSFRPRSPPARVLANNCHKRPILQPIGCYAEHGLSVHIIKQ